MKPFSLDHLNETEFEEFCYDLLGELGFVNINWRKGTGLVSSPSDRGRDIECQLERTDIDGNKYFEKWFVQCKHHKKGVPPTELQGILTWATAENPDKVLIIASNFLSNPAKDFLKDYERTNKPRFKIKIWERPDLDRLTLDRPQLLRTYEIVGEPSVGEPSYLSILHPTHILYMKGIQLNSLDYLFRILDKLDPGKRDEVLGWTYKVIIKPRYREPIPGKKETLGELRIGDVSYDIFKRSCYQIVTKNVIEEYLLVFLIINLTLQFWLSLGDKSSIDESISRMEHMLAFFQSKLREEAEDKEALQGIIRLTEDSIRNAPANIQRNYEVYEYFCENVVSALLLEDIFAHAKPPPLPHAFYGTVQINGREAPIGTKVEATGEGVLTGIAGNPIVTTELGRYGSADPFGVKLLVQGNVVKGATITFYVNDVCAGQTATWHSDEVTQLNLTASIVGPARETAE